MAAEAMITGIQTDHAIYWAHAVSPQVVLYKRIHAAALVGLQYGRSCS
jgi:hypothetical protein